MISPKAGVSNCIKPSNSAAGEELIYSIANNDLKELVVRKVSTNCPPTFIAGSAVKFSS